MKRRGDGESRKKERLSQSRCKSTEQVVKPIKGVKRGLTHSRLLDRKSCEPERMRKEGDYRCKRKRNKRGDV